MRANQQSTIITSVENKKQRTFTLYVMRKGILNAKYRTFKMNKAEFEEAEHNTSDDWVAFLKQSQQYEALKLQKKTKTK